MHFFLTVGQNNFGNIIAFSQNHRKKLTIDEAICHHAVYFAIWKKYGCLPERFNWKLNGPDVKFYPLRPEFMESTYLLYQVILCRDL